MVGTISFVAHKDGWWCFGLLPHDDFCSKVSSVLLLNTAYGMCQEVAIIGTLCQTKVASVRRTSSGLLCNLL
jgi:hypothetical protein